MFDGEAFGDQIVAAVKDVLQREVAPLKAEIAGLRSKLAELEARPVDLSETVKAAYVDEQTSALRSEVAELKALVEAIPEPVETPDVKSLVEAEVAKLPVAKDGEPGRDGKDADPEVIRTMVAEAVAEIPRPEPLPAPTLTDLAPMVDEAVQRAFSGLPAAKDGVSLAGAIIDRAGNLVVTLSDGTTRELGPVVGKDGDPGRDGEPGPAGFSLDDFDITRPDERTMILAFTRGDRTDTYEIGLSAFLDKGVFKDGQDYETGDGVTWGGSYWLAQEATKERPGEGSTAWRLAVKRGANGKDADPAPMLRLIEQKFSEEEERLIKRLEAFLRSKGLI